MSRPQPNIVMTPEMQEEFESELLWCIQQLKDSLKYGKLDKKESDSQQKSLDGLMGNKPISHKRQTMRNLFGEYRAKMAEEKKKLPKTNLKITVERMKPHKNSICLRKRTTESTQTVSDEKIKYVQIDNSFRFNFDEN